MITIQITAEQIERAKKRYDFKILNGSVMKGTSNIFGALGEVIYMDFMTQRGFKVLDESTFDYDFICNGFKVDVKSSRIKSTFIPEDGFECRIINSKQTPHFYFFCKILEDLSLAYLLGYISKKELSKQAIFTKNGDSGLRGEPFNYRGDGWHIYSNSLNSFKIN